MTKQEAQGVIIGLEKDSKYFKTLVPKQKLFVAEYCTNGFVKSKACKSVKISNKTATEYLEDKVVLQAREEFVAAVLAERASQLESRIVDTLWKRAFYNPLMFIDQRGQPRTSDGLPFDPLDFDLDEYMERLGDWVVCITGIKSFVHPKDPNVVSVIVELADRDKALKSLSAYVGLARADEGSGVSSFIVNLNIKDDNKTPFTIVSEKTKVK